jgi:hypothetical protein
MYLALGLKNLKASGSTSCAVTTSALSGWRRYARGFTAKGVAAMLVFGFLTPRHQAGVGLVPDL